MQIRNMLKLINAVVLLLLFSITANSQDLTYRIKGVQKGENNFQYAYLYQSDSKKLLKAKLENGQFEFSGEIAFGKPGFNAGFLFLSNDSSDRFINLGEVVLQKIDRQYRMIILDETPIFVTIENDIKNAKVEGSELNRDYDEMNLAARELGYEEFIDTHRDSPISLLLIRGVLPLKHLPIFDQLNFQELYDKLSNKIKQSEYGLETLKRIKEQE